MGCPVSNVIKTTAITGLLLVITSMVFAIPGDESDKIELDKALDTPKDSTNTPSKKTLQINRRGQLLYENHCLNCHDSTIHIREKNNAKDMNGIRHFVNLWSNELKLKWTSHDIDDVVHYLNLRYYNYSK